MDLRQIRYFVAVYEEGSFSRAAEREHCTQPGISVQVQKLEAELNHRLFERKARGVVATVAGRQLYVSCCEVLAGLRNVRQRMLDLSADISGPLRIGVAPTLCQAALPRALSPFMAKHPYVDIRVAEAFSGTLTTWVVDRELDVAIVTEPPQHLGLTTTPFFRDELVLVMSPQRAKKGPAARNWQDLRALDLVIPSEKHGLRQTIDERVGLKATPGRTVEVDGMLATLELVRTSDWVTVLPVCAVLEKVQRGDLVAEPFGEGGMALDFYLVHTNDEPISLAAQHLLAAVREEASKISQEWRKLNPDEPRGLARPRTDQRKPSRLRKEAKP